MVEIIQLFVANITLLIRAYAFISSDKNWLMLSPKKKHEP